MDEISETFQDQPFKRWAVVAGQWQVEDGVELTTVDKQELYRSPEEPSHVAWVGIWKGSDGSLWIRFPQITGNPFLEPSYAPWYGRADFEGYGVSTWEEFCRLHKMKVGPPDAISSTDLHYITMVSRDSGDTWQNMGAVPGTTIGGTEEARGYNTTLALAADGTLVGDSGMATICCRDGRLLQTARSSEWVRIAKKSRALLGIRESVDNGKTWSPTQWILPEGTDKAIVERVGDENAMVELDDGRILVVMRRDPGSNAQTYLTRLGPGKYAASLPTCTNMEHSGMTSLVRCSDGTIWYWGLQRHFYSVDDGQSWHPLPPEHYFESYYGKMVDIGPDRVLCVSQRGIGDSPYPYHYDAHIEQVRFSYRRIGVMKQTDGSCRTAMLKMSGQSFADLHLRVDVRLDGFVGVAFHVSLDGRSYYVFGMAVPGRAAYARWCQAMSRQAANQQETLAAYFPGLLDDPGRAAKKSRDVAVAFLARVDDGQVTVMRSVVASDFWRPESSDTGAGDWVQLQVKAQGNEIQAAANSGRHLPAYVGARDATYRRGSIGLLTDGGLGEFKGLHIWPSPQLIRDLWTT